MRAYANNDGALSLQPNIITNGLHNALLDDRCVFNVQLLSMQRLFVYPASVTARGGVTFFAEPIEGTELVCMSGTSDELTGLTASGIGEAEMARVQGALAIYCGGCALHIGEDISTVGANISALIGGKPVMGMCTYGEQGVTPRGKNTHGNLMYSLLLFGEQDEP